MSLLSVMVVLLADRQADRGTGRQADKERGRETETDPGSNLYASTPAMYCSAARSIRSADNPSVEQYQRSKYEYV